MSYRGIVFDKDGTLLDFNRTWLPIYLHAASEFAGGVAALAEQLLTHHGFDPERGRFESGSLLAAGNNHQIADAWALQLQQPDQAHSTYSPSTLLDENRTGMSVQIERITTLRRHQLYR